MNIKNKTILLFSLLTSLFLLYIILYYKCIYIKEIFKNKTKDLEEIYSKKKDIYILNKKRITPYVKILWMYWEQGLENILDYHQGEYNKMCFDGWKELNPDWDIRILNKKTALEYVPELVNFYHLTRQSRSDLLRIKLLEKYGGVWADASTLPMRPLTGWIKECDNGTGIFFYRYFKKKGSYIANWFIVAKEPNHYLIKKLADTFEKRVKDKKKKYRYFYFHETLTYLINNDRRINNYINRLSVPAMPLRAYFFKKYIPIKHDKGLNKPLLYKRYLKVNHKDYNAYLNTF